MKSIKRNMVVFVLASMVMLVQVIPVEAVSILKDSDLSSKDVVEILESVDKEEVVSEVVKEEGKGYVVETDSQTVTVNEKNELKVVSDIDDEQLDVGISFLLDEENAKTTQIDNTIVMDDEDDDYFVTTEVFDGGLRNSFIIEETCNEENFPIQFDLPAGAYLEFSEDEYEGNKRDGSLLIRDVNNAIIGAIDIPWAKDANENNVETYYKIEGNTVVQHVNHRGVENIQYPIVADPLIAFETCFKSGKWITRNGVVSLSLKPSVFLRMAMIQGSSSMRKYSWSAVLSKFKKSKKWKNTSSMKDQYHCHWYFATFKSEFNLEPSRKSTNWFNMITHLCNP